MVVDGEQRLRYRTVELVRFQGEHAVVGGGLETGEQVCISPLDVVVDGMRVRTVEAVVDELPARGWGDEAEPLLPEALPPEPLPAEPLPMAADSAEPSPSATEPAAAAPPATPGALRQAPGRLLSTAIIRGGANSEIRLRIAGEYESSTMRLEEPERFAIDLVNVVNESPRSRVEYGDGPVERLRISQFQSEPMPVVRIVFDLRFSTAPAVARTADGLTVSFDS